MSAQAEDCPEVSKRVPGRLVPLLFYNENCLLWLYVVYTPPPTPKKTKTRTTKQPQANKKQQQNLNISEPFLKRNSETG